MNEIQQLLIAQCQMFEPGHKGYQLVRTAMDVQTDGVDEEYVEKLCKEIRKLLADGEDHYQLPD